ncbi:small neutral amino acid transporter SnatA (MarC family) [Alkalihalobacillus xiaoxiensis]|uniref:UPF0056 membrane protein n=1 Tax=Shouchella xiaoxiensis TaxID=766895 RepID=A0ABS2T195_9BACI|nr:MarC family protein [Shouchella xiaoxiensis]MBM7840252.1 small neutral amino acid transporter SnatA (MarC family) [Shouchella xiaoxiensis]
MFSFFIHAFVSIFAVTHPLLNVSAVPNRNKNEEVIAYRTHTIEVILMLMAIGTVVLIVGQFVFSWFHISIQTLRIIGGFIIFVVACTLLRLPIFISKKQTTADDELKTHTKDGFFNSFPILKKVARTVESLTSRQSFRLLHICITYSAICFVLSIAYGLHMILDWFQGRVNNRVWFVLTKLAGILLATFALEMVLVGLTDVFPIFEQKAA